MPKLAGEFEFLGSAKKGDPRFDAPPPSGVVKVYHLPPDCRPGSDGTEPTSCGFFECSRWRFGAFMRASAAWNHRTSWGRYDCVGDWPVARTIVIPDKTDQEKAATKNFFDQLTGGRGQTPTPEAATPTGVSAAMPRLQARAGIGQLLALSFGLAAAALFGFTVAHHRYDFAVIELVIVALNVWLFISNGEIAAKVANQSQ